jgi:hypothetical protein
LRWSAGPVLMRHSRVSGTTFSTVSWCLLGTVREHAPAHSRFTQSCSRTPRHSHSNRDTGRSSAEGRGSSTGAGVETCRHPLHGTHTRHTRDTRAHGSHRRTSQPSQTIPNHQRTHSLSGVCPGSPGVFLPVQYRYFLHLLHLLNSHYVPSRRGDARHACRYSRGSWQCAVGSELQFWCCRFCNCRGSILGTVVGCTCSEQSGVCSGNL